MDNSKGSDSQPILKSVFQLSISSAISNGISILQIVFVLKLIEPKLWGLWSGLQLIQTYGMQSHLGILNAVNRQLPYYVGKGDVDKTDAIRRSARTNILLLSGLGALLIVLFVMFMHTKFENKIIYGVIAFGLATIISLNVEYYLCLFRAYHQFDRVALISLVNSVLTFFGLFFVYWLHYEGLCLRVIVVSLISLFICYKMNKWQLSYSFDLTATKELLTIGFPIAVISYLFVFFDSIQKIAILNLLGSTFLGYYGIALGLSSIIAIIPGTIGYVLYPKMCERYGRTNNPKDLLDLTIKASAISFVFVLVIVTGLFFTIRPIVNGFFPQYAQGIEATKIALFQGLPMALGIGPYFFMQAIMKQKQYVIVFIIASGLNYLVSYYLVSQGWGLKSAAWGGVIGYMVYMVCSWILVYMTINNKKDDPLALGTI
jgi:O-antigen/teichoic acid export membrane protein